MDDIYVTSNKHLKVLRDDPGQRSRQLLIRGSMYHVKKHFKNFHKIAIGFFFNYMVSFCPLAAKVISLQLGMVMMRNFRLLYPHDRIKQQI